jgi:hypothetical protein
MIMILRSQQSKIVEYLSIILIFVLGVYTGLPGRVRAEYLFSLCVISLLSSRFNASALVWFSNFLKYLVFHIFYFTEHCVHWRSSWILWLFMYQGGPRNEL